MATPDEVVAEVRPEVRGEVERLRALVRSAAPELEETVRWGAVAYVGRRIVCTIMPHERHVNLQLFGGAELARQGFTLRGAGKAMRHVTVKPGQPVDEAELRRLLAAAARLDAATT